MKISQFRIALTVLFAGIGLILSKGLSSQENDSLAKLALEETQGERSSENGRTDLGGKKQPNPFEKNSGNEK